MSAIHFSVSNCRKGHDAITICFYLTLNFTKNEGAIANFPEYLVLLMYYKSALYSFIVCFEAQRQSS